MDAIGISVGADRIGGTIQTDFATNPPIIITLGAASVSTPALSATCVLLHATQPCWYTIGPTAAAHVAGNDYLAPGIDWLLKVPPGAVLSFIQAAAGGYAVVSQAANPQPVLSGGPLLLDNVPGALAAYSLRRIRAAYGGAAVNIRRSSDNATQDIGFSGNDFNVAAFSAFVGAGTGFVATWYDQAGSANATAIGGSSANQSPIALAVTNGKAVVQATATTQGLIAPTPANQAVVSFSTVSNRTGNQTNHNVIFSFDGNCPGMDYTNSANGGIVIGNVGVAITTPAVVTDNAFHAAVGIMNGAATQITAETGASGSNSITGATGSTQIDLIGRAGFGFLGYLAEAIVWNRALVAGDQSTIFADQRAYYGF